MTEAEKKEIVALVMSEISGQAVDFDLQTVTPQRTDILPAVRPGGEGGYTGVTLDWGGITDELTTQAKEFRNEALQAKKDTELLKGETNDIKSDVENIYIQFNKAVDKTIESVRNVYQSDLNAESTARQTADNTLQQNIDSEASTRQEADQTLAEEVNGLVDSVKELNEKKITKFYASNNGNTNLPDSDNGKPSDIKIFGKSVQDGTPTPDNPIEIQSVVNPKLSVCGVNVFDYEKYITSSSYKESGYTVRNYQLEPNTKYYFKNIVRKSNGSVGIWLLQPNDSTINGENFIGLTTNYPLIESFTTKQDGIIKIGYMNVVYENYLKDNLIISTNEIVTSVFVPFKGYQTATLPYTLNAIPVSDGGNVTIDGQQYIADYVDVERGKLVKMVDSSKFDNTQSIVNKTEWLLAEPQEIGLTQEEVQILKTLATHYPITNVITTSDQLDGYTTFNYPLNMANGWNYVMQQIGETRPIIYDTQVKTIENLIDTAILTAMMEA